MDLVTIVQAYVNKEKIEIPEDVNLLQLSIEQSLQTLLFPVSSNPKFKKYYISWVTMQEHFYSIQNELTELFNSKGIHHFFFKGSVLSKLYDDPSVRTRGDIDCYVDPKRLEDAKALLFANGYETENGDHGMHHIGFEKENVEVEIHFSMLEEGNVDSSWTKLLKNPIELCEVENDCLLSMRPTYHFIYCMMHFAQHLRTGAGLRYMLDFYYMLKKTPIDFELLHSLLNKCEMTTLYENIINEVRMLTNEDFDSTVENKDIQFFTDYLLSHGIHGHANNDTDSRTAAHKHKFKHFIVRVFLTNKGYRVSRFPKMGKHIILYPIMLIWHWIWLITHRFESFIKFVFGKNRNKDLYKQLGI